MNVTEYFEDIKKYGSAPGLESIKRLTEQLGNPQDQLRIIHIAGTNGKGSILAMLESVLRKSGYCTGRYVSPVLFDEREAFQINGRWISNQALEDYVSLVKKAADDIVRRGFPHPTIFEVETAVAFSYFAAEKVDVVLLETGMGGRLDATNIIKRPLIEILSSISMDHMQFLGNTLEEIATEKAGIIKENTEVILYPSDEEVYGAVKKCAEEKHAALTMADGSAVRMLSRNLREQSFAYRSSQGNYYEKITIPLLGEFQIYNAITAIEALEKLKKFFCMNLFEIEEGLKDVKWPGRLEIISHNPYMIRDGAHNEDAAKQLAGFLEKNFTNKKIFYIIGVLQDKEYKKILEIMSPFSDTVCTVSSANPRALPARELAQCAKNWYQNVDSAESVRQAVTKVQKQAGEQDLILLFGSLSFMNEIEELRKDGTISKDYRT